MTQVEKLRCGTVDSGLAATALPDVKVTNFVVIKAHYSNDSIVYIGNSDLTVPSSSVGTATSYALWPGESTPPIKVRNLSSIYHKTDDVSGADGTADLVPGISYWVS